MKQLNIAKKLKLPVDAVTQTFGFIGRKGSGKTNAAGVMVEQLISAGAPVVILDPVGNWWGLRVAKDGKAEGISIPVFGGLRGDVPIEPEAGHLIADLIVDESISAILDVSQFSKGARKRFVTDFVEQFFARMKRDPFPIHLVLEEAHLFVPQKIHKGEERMYGALEELIRLGRNFGIGCSMISQRPQTVNKEVLSQVEALCVFQVNEKHARKAINEWIVSNSLDVGHMVDELPSLPVGTAFFWSPQWLGILDRFEFHLKRTFDASATPKLGDKKKRTVEPRKLREDEVESLTSAMSEVVERAEANDPTALKRKLAQAEKKIAQLEATAAQPPEMDAADLAQARAEGAEEARQEFAKIVEGFDRVKESQRELLKIAGEAISSAVEGLDAVEPVEVPKARVREARIGRRVETRSPVRTPARAAVVTEGVDGPMQRILDALAWLESAGIPSPYSRIQVAFLAKYKAGSGGFNNPLGRLRTAELVEYPSGGMIALTTEGRAAANTPDGPFSHEDLHERIRERIDTPMQRILFPLIDAYPDAIGREELAELAGYTHGSGGFNNPLGRLRTLGLIDYPRSGEVIALPVLFP